MILTFEQKQVREFLVDFSLNDLERFFSTINIKYEKEKIIKSNDKNIQTNFTSFDFDKELDQIKDFKCWDDVKNDVKRDKMIDFFLPYVDRILDLNKYYDYCTHCGNGYKRKIHFTLNTGQKVKIHCFTGCSTYDPELSFSIDDNQFILLNES